MVQLPRNYVVALRVRAGYRERDTRESKMGTYSVPGHVDGGDYHYIYDGWIEAREVMGAVAGLMDSPLLAVIQCGALQG